MKFPGEGFGWHGVKTPEAGKDLQKYIEDLAAESSMQDNIIGLHEWDKEVMKQEHESQVKAMKEEQEEQIKTMEEANGIDYLTGALLRRVFEKEIDRILPMIRNEKKEQREGASSYREASLIFIDVDKFKSVNDTYGHDVGDTVLRKIATLLKETLRDTDLLGRYGGDEFVAFLPNTSEKNAIEIANKLRTKIDEDSSLKGYGVTGSFGVCSTDVSTAGDAKNFMKHADEAAYLAKEAGGNQVRVYT